ncbi:MAG: hypothetical protein OHK93_007921 [Ramalina farinacea]|uniref:Uncharacterized protein n=1 Tax=Ramalina farinacea TaxID=258253 RepID=A0AA43QLF4_9LECA|nr:hypothetical protein [Ramalina farinacea]
MERNWHPDSMDLQIIHGCDDSITNFDFGVIEGVMMLDTDENLLRRRWKSQQGRKPRNKLYYEDGSSVTDEDDPCNESDEEEFPSSTTGLPCDEPEQPSDTVDQPNRKRQKLYSPAGERRLYFMWRDRETGQNEIQLDLHGDNQGSILLLDATCSTLRGTFSASCIGSNVEFEGYKMSLDTEPLQISWEDYSEDVYERERVGRWGSSRLR